jgi:hypothetical protein
MKAARNSQTPNTTTSQLKLFTVFMIYLLLLLKIFGVSGTPLQSWLYLPEVNGTVAESEYQVKK